jgi:ArsR family metal-binding transcriptional regulator
MGRIIVANRHGHQLVEWDATVDTDEARAAIADAERIIEEARASGCAISKKVDGEHVLDREPFDPSVDEYQIIAPIAGG